MQFVNDMEGLNRGIM